MCDFYTIKHIGIKLTIILGIANFHLGEQPKCGNGRHQRNHIMISIPTCVRWHGCLGQQSYLKVGGHGHVDPRHSTITVFLCVCRLLVLRSPKVLLCPDLCGLTVGLTSSLYQLKGIQIL